MTKQKIKYLLKENWYILLSIVIVVGLFIFGVKCNTKVASEAKRCGLLGMSYTEYKETHTFTDWGTFNLYRHIAEEKKEKGDYTELESWWKQ